MLFLNTTLQGLEFGLCYGLLALGLYVSYTILDFPDLSVDGIFPLGGIMGTIAMYNWGFHPVAALFVSMIVGMAAGSITGFLHVKCKISKLLCGIIVMTGMTSITLALTMVVTGNGYPLTIIAYGAKGVEGLFGSDAIMSLPSTARAFVIIAILFAILVAFKLLMDLFLKTKLGFMIRATGSNEQLVISMGRDPGNYKILGLAIANGLVGISGCLYAQLMKQYDNTCGSGKVVIALAAVIMGVTIFSNSRFIKGTTAVCIGAIIYSLALYYFTLVDTNGIFLKLFNAAFFALVIILSSKYKELHSGGLKVLFKKKAKESGDGRA